MSKELKDAIAYYKSCSEYNDEIKTLINLAEKYLEAGEKLGETANELVSDLMNNDGQVVSKNTYDICLKHLTIQYMKLKEQNDELKKENELLRKRVEEFAGRLSSKNMLYDASLEMVLKEKSRALNLEEQNAKLKEQLARLKGE